MIGWRAPLRTHVRRAGALVLAAVLLAAAAACEREVVLAREMPDFCGRLPGLPAAPTIDGVLERELSLRPLPPAGWEGVGTAPPAGVSADYAVAWHPQGLYFYVLVTDPTRDPAPPGVKLYCGDAVELFVDADGVFTQSPALDEVGAFQFIIAGPSNDVDPVARAERFKNRLIMGNWSGNAAFGAFPRPGGFAVEAFVRAEDLGLSTWSLRSAERVAFDISINVGGRSPPMAPTPDCVTRIGQFTLRVSPTAPPAATSGHPYWTVEAFCPAVLGAALTPSISRGTP